MGRAAHRTSMITESNWPISHKWAYLIVCIILNRRRLPADAVPVRRLKILKMVDVLGVVQLYLLFKYY